MKNLSIIPLSFILLVFAGCQRGEHFLKDKTYREKVEAQFEKQKQLGKNRLEQVFRLTDQKIPLREKEAMKFILAYSPLSDIADYNGEFFLRNIRASFAARDSFSWGKTLPDELFRHFVLPVRVNNENLDSSRTVFFAELKNRIKKMSMRDAALEVNHWCHEKVTYRGTDERTSSPLATVRTAYGRCGEESTFTVAALRSVCIPARQCYTPRWAHSDDNHAWVEVWVDGRWHFIGACEPDADLDLAWFTAPAKRAMLVTTNVFGDYEGPEDVLIRDTRYTRINILPNYTNTKRIFARVVVEHKKPVDSAIVEFQLYNYAEFYTLQKSFTGKNGVTSFLTGYGDLLIQASKGGRYGYRKVTVGNTDTAVIELSMKPGKVYAETFDIVPPPEIKVEAKVSDPMKAINAKRLAFEDKIRSDYEATFIDSAKTMRLAPNLKLNADSLWIFLKKSRGNYRGIIDFVSGAPDDKKHLIFPLLSSISEKDLRDITPEVLTDHLDNVLKFASLTHDKEIFNSCILSPRVDNEWLKPFRAFFQEKFDKPSAEKFRKSPDSLVVWIRHHILIDNLANYGRAPLTPVGSFELEVTDPHSRDILFVAMCRSFGIPARLEPGTRVPQNQLNEAWYDVYFEKPPQVSNARGTLVLTSDPANGRKPEYYTHFTIEKFEDGFFRSLDYESDPQVGKFPCSLSIAPGYYVMVTGNRIQGGTVLASLEFFNLEAGKTATRSIVLRKNQLPPADFGKINPGLFTYKFKEGMIMAWVDPGEEPTNHLIADLRSGKSSFENWKGHFVLVFPTEEQMKSFQSKEAAGLPKTLSYTCQTSFPVKLSEIPGRLGSLKNLPVVIFINEKGIINYLSEGYKIGIGDDLLRLIR